MKFNIMPYMEFPYYPLGQHSEVFRDLPQREGETALAAVTEYAKSFEETEALGSGCFVAWPPGRLAEAKLFIQGREHPFWNALEHVPERIIMVPFGRGKA